jgi:acetyl-CoA synthetase
MRRASVIRKNAADFVVTPNFVDEASTRTGFSGELARRAHAGRAAFRFLDPEGPPRPLSYSELARLTDTFCCALRRLGIGIGNRLVVLCGRIPELYISMLGALKNGTVVSPLSSAFGPEPITTRINLGEGKVLVTSESLYQRKLEAIRDSMLSLEHVLRVSDRTHYMIGLYALDLHDEDIFWCTADPGWVTGTSYGILAPLLYGVSSIVDPADFDAGRWYGILQEPEVTVWYTAPTAIRMLMKAGAGLAHQYRFPKVRLIASVGESLNPEAVGWGQTCSACRSTTTGGRPRPAAS